MIYTKLKTLYIIIYSKIFHKKIEKKIEILETEIFPEIKKPEEKPFEFLSDLEIFDYIKISELHEKLHETYNNEYLLTEELVITYNISRDFRYICSSFIQNNIEITIKWEDGITKQKMQKLLYPIINKHIQIFTRIDRRMYIFYNVKFERSFNNETILKASEKYAACICEKLPVNKGNISLLKVGGVTILELVKAELEEITLL